MTKKYIVVKDTFGGEAIIVFSAGLYHKNVAGSMKVVSAGFMDVTYDDFPKSYNVVDKMNVHCYGESQSLKIGCRPEEDKILAKILLRGE